MSLCQPVIWSMAAILRDSTVVVVVVVVAAAAVVRTRPRAKPLATITMRKSTYGFSFVSNIWVAYGAPLQAMTSAKQQPIRQPQNPFSFIYYFFYIYVLSIQ